MTRTTNARIAGFTYLFYAAIGICGDLLMHHAFGGADDATTLARLGEYATEVRIDILIKLLEALSALVLAVTLYGPGTGLFWPRPSLLGHRRGGHKPGSPQLLDPAAFI